MQNYAELLQAPDFVNLKRTAIDNLGTNNRRQQNDAHSSTPNEFAIDQETLRYALQYSMEAESGLLRLIPGEITTRHKRTKSGVSGRPQKTKTEPSIRLRSKPESGRPKFGWPESGRPKFGWPESDRPESDRLGSDLPSNAYNSGYRTSKERHSYERKEKERKPKERESESAESVKPAIRWVTLLVRTYFEEIHKIVCGKQGKLKAVAKRGGSQATVSALAAWLAQSLGFEEPIAIGAAVFLFQILIMASHGTFCRMTKAQLIGKLDVQRTP